MPPKPLLNLRQHIAEIFVPDKSPLPAALRRITHLGIGAHQDDLEFMAFHGIAECFASKTKWFGGVTCTNGSGSARAGRFINFSDAEMMAVRRREQDAAAKIGRYAAMIQLACPSRDLRRADNPALKNDLKQILAATKPQVIYTHNLADRHKTHLGVALAVIAALRELPRATRPEKIWGCEVWRSLDWLPDADKVVLDVSGHDRLAARLNRVFRSQIAGGKRYDLAVPGRRAANATFFASHATDAARQVVFAMDLAPLLRDETLNPAEYANRLVEKFRDEVKSKLRAAGQRI